MKRRKLKFKLKKTTLPLNPFPLKGSFSPHCSQVLAHIGSSNYWGFLCILVGSQPFNINRLEVTVEILHYKKKIEQIQVFCILEGFLFLILLNI